jgi:protein SCO1/2
MCMSGGRTGARLMMLCSLVFAGLAFTAALTVIPGYTRAENPVTIGGPWTLVAPDGATVTDRTYLGKWLSR